MIEESIKLLIDIKSVLDQYSDDELSVIDVALVEGSYNTMIKLLKQQTVDYHNVTALKKVVIKAYELVTQVGFYFSKVPPGQPEQWPFPKDILILEVGISNLLDEFLDGYNQLGLEE